MDKETKSIRVDPELWDDAKIHCVQEHIDISKYIDLIMRNDLHNGKTKNKEPDNGRRKGKKAKA